MPHDHVDLGDDTPHIFSVETQEDYERCLALRKEVFVEEQKVPLSIEIDGFEAKATYFLGVSKGEDVITGRIRKTSQGIKFERILTVKRYRGKGFGSLLMHYMQEYCAEHFASTPCYMHSQIKAVPFYTKLGWQIQGESFEEAGIEHLKMIYHHQI